MNAPLGRKALAIAVLFATFGAAVVGVVGCARLPMASGSSVPEAAATASPEDVILAYWTAKNQATRDVLSSEYKLEQEAEWRRRRNPAASQSDDINRHPFPSTSRGSGTQSNFAAGRIIIEATSRSARLRFTMSF